MQLGQLSGSCQSLDWTCFLAGCSSLVALKLLDVPLSKAIFEFEQHIILYFIYGLRYKVYCTFPFSYGPAACGTIHQASFGLGYVCAYQALSNCQEDRRTGPCACCSKSFGEWFSSEACLCGTLARMPSLNHGKTMQDLSSRNTFFFTVLCGVFFCEATRTFAFSCAHHCASLG